MPQNDRLKIKFIIVNLICSFLRSKYKIIEDFIVLCFGTIKQIFDICVNGMLVE